MNNEENYKETKKHSVVGQESLSRRTFVQMWTQRSRKLHCMMSHSTKAICPVMIGTK